MVKRIPIIIITKEGNILSNQLRRRSVPPLTSVAIATNLAIPITDFKFWIYSSKLNKGIKVTVT
jgi:hypothetical protein